VLFIFGQKIQELRVQLSQFKEGKAMPYSFDWPVNEDGKQVAYSDQDGGQVLCDSVHRVNQDHSEQNDRNSSGLTGSDGDGITGSDGDGSIGLDRVAGSDTGSTALSGAVTNCANDRTSDEDVGSENSANVDNGNQHHSKPPKLDIGAGDSGFLTSYSTDGPISNSTLTDPSSSSSVSSAVPTSSQCDTAQTDSDVAELKKAPTEVMSPRSYALFKSGLVHVPEMNLPWESMRTTTKCCCGVTFSYSVRKVRTKGASNVRGKVYAVTRS
jgi:hypothetical protein